MEPGRCAQSLSRLSRTGRQGRRQNYGQLDGYHRRQGKYRYDGGACLSRLVNANPTGLSRNICRLTARGISIPRGARFSGWSQLALVCMLIPGSAAAATAALSKTIAPLELTKP